MEVSIATAADYDRIVDLFSRTNFSLQEAEWFRWKHLDNPLGNSIVFKVQDDNDTIVATVSLLRQTYHFRDKQYVALQAVDGVIDQEVRGKRLFSKMMAAILEHGQSDQGQEAFFIGFSSLTNSVKALESAGWNCLTNFRSTTYLLDSSKFSSCPGGWFLSMVLAVPCLLARKVMCNVPGARRFTVRQATTVPPDFDHGFLRSDKVTGDRSGSVFTWRVLQNPRDALEVFLVEDALGKLAGYAVGRLHQGDYEVLEWKFKRNQREGLSALLRFLYNTRKVASVTCVGFKAGDCFWEAPPFGIKRRNVGGSVFVYRLENVGLPVDPAFWNLTVLDSDW